MFSQIWTLWLSFLPNEIWTVSFMPWMLFEWLVFRIVPGLNIWRCFDQTEFFRYSFFCLFIRIYKRLFLFLSLDIISYHICWSWLIFLSINKLRKLYDPNLVWCMFSWFYSFQKVLIHKINKTLPAQDKNVVNSHPVFKKVKIWYIQGLEN